MESISKYPSKSVYTDSEEQTSVHYIANMEMTVEQCKQIEQSDKRQYVFVCYLHDQRSDVSRRVFRRGLNQVHRFARA